MENSGSQQGNNTSLKPIGDTNTDRNNKKQAEMTSEKMTMGAADA